MCYVDTMYNNDDTNRAKKCLRICRSFVVKCMKYANKHTRNIFVFKLGKAIIEETYKVFIQHYCC